MEKATTTLNLSKSLYKQFKELAKRRFSSVTKEFNIFMKNELKKERGEDVQTTAD